MQFGEGRDDHADGDVTFVSNVNLFAKFFNDRVDFVLILNLSCIFAHDPRNNLHK